ncbi:P-loop containing nucleoside triphosphate hydrolase protein [Mycena floridula]|nr:P-loop containing nucleoside triphosphate hydrolase protein [Mycena floridula]
MSQCWDLILKLSSTVYLAFGIFYVKGVLRFSLFGHERRVAGDRNALWFFLIAILSMICLGFQNYLFASSSASLTAKLRSRSFKAILRQDIEFFDKDENSTGSLTSRLSDNPQKPVVVLKDQANKKAHESSAQLACEATGSILTVAALTREADCCNLYSKSLEAPLCRSNRTALSSNLLYALSQSMIFFVIALVFWYGSILVSKFKYTTFQFFVGLMSSVFAATQAGNVFSFVPDVSSAKGAGSDIIKLIDSMPEIDAESPDGKKIDSSKTQGHIRFENVHFRYPTRPAVRVLRDLSLQVEPCTYIALVRASGCGKSTVSSKGSMILWLLDGELITEFNIQEYRKQIALVSQEPTLYAGTEEIETACRNANILEFIQSLPELLPEGFDTEVGGKGSQLSGQKCKLFTVSISPSHLTQTLERIAIARALLRNPKVLLLDEATSGLDSNSAKVVQEALDKAAKGRTTIAIAHRLSTIQNADRIYFIKEGRVSESGTRDQLLTQRGDYYEFVQLQALSKR